MNGINCSICYLEFNDASVIPKILQCGHSFCSPCLDQLMNTSPVCPNCRKTIVCAREECATNFALLELVNSINSYKWKEINATRRIHGLRNKFTAKQEKIIKDKTELLSNLEKVQKALTQIEKMSSGSKEEANVDSVDEVIANLESVYQGLRIQTSPDFSSIKANVSLKFDTFESPSAYLQEIRRHLQNGDQVYSIANVEDGIQYGKITTEDDDLLLVHAVDNQGIPEGQTSVWFHDLKKCFNGSYPSQAFFKVSCLEKDSKLLLQIDLRGFEANRFLELCTGELGPSYKRCPFSVGGDYQKPSLYMNGDFLRKKGKETQNNQYIDSLRFTNYTSKGNEVLLQNFSLGNFEFFYHRSAVQCCNVIGTVTPSTNFQEFFTSSKNAQGWEIIDCGFLFKI